MDAQEIKYSNLSFIKDEKIKRLDKRIIHDNEINRDIGIIKLLEDVDDKNNQCFSLSIDIDYDMQGRGYATKALNFYIDYIFRNTNIDKITNYIAGGAGNVGSIKLHEKLHFVKEESSNKNFYRYSITKRQFQSIETKDNINDNLNLTDSGVKLKNLTIE